ncbi:MAG: DUF4296 domain-containing protein [Bacteroidaceae bacterium]|nr:DUF4296 domain-containing protein [Bacteroidaceae bacterium]
MRRILLILSAVVLVFDSCRDGIPGGVLSRGEMEDVLVDYHLAEAMAEQMPGDRDENTYLMVEAVLRKHNVTRAELDSSLVYWCRNSEKFKDIYLNVYKRLDVMAQDVGVEHQEQSMYSNLKTEGDTANVWTLKTHALLLPNELDNIYAFTLDSDTTYHPADNLMWAFETLFFSAYGADEAYALLCVTFENDSIAGVSQRLGGNGPHEVRFACPEKFRKHRIRNISGNIYLPIYKDGFGCLAVNRMVMVRYHRKGVTESEKGEAFLPDTLLSLKASGKGVVDSANVRLAPHDIRGDRAKQHTIDIVKEKPIRAIRRHR